MPKGLVHRGPPLRSHIDLTKTDEVRYWIKHLGVEKARLADAIERVGNSVAAVRKERNIAPSDNVA